jgi:hypothetical protein
MPDNSFVFSVNGIGISYNKALTLSTKAALAATPTCLSATSPPFKEK